MWPRNNYVRHLPWRDLKLYRWNFKSVWRKSTDRKSFHINSPTFSMTLLEEPKRPSKLITNLLHSEVSNHFSLNNGFLRRKRNKRERERRLNKSTNSLTVSWIWIEQIHILHKPWDNNQEWERQAKVCIQTNNINKEVQDNTTEVEVAEEVTEAVVEVTCTKVATCNTTKQDLLLLPCSQVSQDSSHLNPIHNKCLLLMEWYLLKDSSNQWECHNQ